MEQLTVPAYANELRAARALGAVNLHACVGANAWKRAQRSGHRPRLVIDLRQHAPETFDFSCCAGLDLVLNARDCDEPLARAVARRICEHGARLVVLLLPGAIEFVYGVRS